MANWKIPLNCAVALMLSPQAACNPVQCLRTNYFYSGTKTGVFYSKMLDEKGGVSSATGGGAPVGMVDLDAGAPQDCWGPPGSIPSGRVIAWLDVTGADQGNCAADLLSVLCAPRVCDPQGSTPFEINGSLTTINVVLTDPDAGCP